MTKLTVLTYPDPAATKKALPVTAFNEPVALFIDDLFETMYANEGVGFAATQVNIPQRILVADPNRIMVASLLYGQPRDYS